MASLFLTFMGSVHLVVNTWESHSSYQIWKVQPFCRQICFRIGLQGSFGHEDDLTHWGRVTHICVANLAIIRSDNGLSPGRRQAIIGTNDGILLIGPLGTNFSEILIEILTFSFKKISLNVSSAKWRPFYLGLNVLIWQIWQCCWHIHSGCSERGHHYKNFMLSQRNYLPGAETIVMFRALKLIECVKRGL